MLSVMRLFVYETGTPGTISLFKNPIDTEIEMNKTGTYFSPRKR